MLRQETIKKWMKGSNKNNLEKAYFYLDWKLDMPINISWYHKIPRNVKWKRVIKVGYREITLCSSFVPIEKKFITNENLKPYHSFLISHLQKAVRRRKHIASIYSADVLLEINPIKLLRRLPIIMLEDTQLHKSLNVLVWLMCLISDNKHQLTEYHKRWILGVVYLLSSSKYKEIVNNNNEWVFYKKIKVIHSLKNMELQDIIYSLETRNCYGGMKGDSLMIENFQSVYLKRYLRNDIDKKYESFFYEKIIPIMTKTIKFTRKNFLLEGYDFHCNSSLPYILECEFPENNINEYKTAIWLKSSSTNNRVLITFAENKFIICINKFIPSYIKTIWNNIRSFVRKKAWGFIQMMSDDLEYYKLLTIC